MGKYKILGELWQGMGQETKKASAVKLLKPLFDGLRGQDLNLRPSGYEPDELPDCSTPRRSVSKR